MNFLLELKLFHFYQLKFHFYYSKIDSNENSTIISNYNDISILLIFIMD
jgi:hypothetical protein